jgi:hypothetical protein
MPRPRVENKKQVFTIRLTPQMAEEVRSLNPNLSQAVEQALVVWIKRERRKAGRPARPTGQAPLPAARAGDRGAQG